MHSSRSQSGESDGRRKASVGDGNATAQAAEERPPTSQGGRRGK